MEWARGRAEKNLSNRPEKTEGYGIVPVRHPYEPCYNFEAGILPLDHYPITGVIWYQGESNAERVEVHEEIFPLLVDSWRQYFSEDGRSQPAMTGTVIPSGPSVIPSEAKESLPFYYVQLSSLNAPAGPFSAIRSDG